MKAFLVAVSVVAALIAFAAAVSWWWGTLAVAGVLGYARVRRWPAVKFKHYAATAKAVLPIAAAAAGAGAQEAFDHLHSPIHMLTAGAVAATGVAVVSAIFEGKLMKDIFDLVPPEQRPALEAFAAGRAPQGQHADLSALDPATVIATIKAGVIGQDAAVTGSVQTAFRRARLARPNKPVATLLFVGATGAGKTELAKALATELFNGRLVRVDCNELSGDGSAQRLTGAPPGYIGSDKGSAFCRDIGRLGTGVILLDEIEKAHPTVLKTVMGLLDEGRVTELSTGTTYSATGFLVVLTSNARQEEIGKIVAAVADPIEQAKAVRDELKAGGFPPEVLGRMDGIYPFVPLDRTALIRIVGKFLQGFARDAGVEIVSVDYALLIDLVTQAETLRSYGVREVVRRVENAVTDGLLAIKDDGYKRAAIKVIDGHVDVQPVAAEALGQRAAGGAK